MYSDSVLEFGTFGCRFHFHDTALPCKKRAYAVVERFKYKSLVLEASAKPIYSPFILPVYTMQQSAVVFVSIQEHAWLLTSVHFCKYPRTRLAANKCPFLYISHYLDVSSTACIMSDRVHAAKCIDALTNSRQGHLRTESLAYARPCT